MPKTCNCRKINKDNCPLKGNCLNKNSKPTKPKSDKLSNMPKNSNFCRINKDNCPLKGNCLIENVIYKVKVESKGPDKISIVSTANSFKYRYTNCNIV